jgi:uncharacterized membrane protein (UPF0127 family)
MKRLPATVLLIVLAVTGCARTPSSQAPPPAPAQPAAQAVDETQPRVVLPDGFVVRVEVVADDEMRAQGLMFRDQLLPGTGMLFLFPRDGEYSFWMKNTRIPLDMIWIDSEQRIAHVKHDVPPCDVEECPSYAPGVTARYVLELAGGVAREHHLEPGQQVRFENVDPSMAR